MKRINGYLDIEEYFKRQLNRDDINLELLEQKKMIKSEYGGDKCMFWFSYTSVPVLFKVYTTTFSAYSELISEELAKFLGIPTAQYDLAIYQGRKGVISYDFKKRDYDYLYVGKMIDIFIDETDLLKKESEENTYNEYYLRDYDILIRDKLKNNLEDIWNALEYYLLNKMNYSKESISVIVEKIMKQLTDYLSFQLISGNYDMHLGNITIGFNKYKEDAVVAPLYDNSDMFKMSGENYYVQTNTPQFTINRGNIAEGKSNTEILEEYLNISDEYFVERFKSFIAKIDENAINEIYDHIEEKTTIPIPDYIKESYLEQFYNNINKLKDVVEQQKRS